MGFSLNSAFLQKDKISDSILIRQNTGRTKPKFRHVLCDIIMIIFATTKLFSKDLTNTLSTKAADI